MNYRDEVLRTAQTKSMTNSDVLLNGVMGLAEEAAEVLGLIKKHRFHKKELNRDALIKELGDVRWYLELICVAIDTTTEQIEETNVAKLRIRYPNGFTAQDAELRRDVK